MLFSEIPGHDDVKERLRQMVLSGHIPNTLLLEGPEGAAKFALARALSQYIHCTARTPLDSCGRCPSCQQHKSHNHIDTIYSFPVVKKSGRTETLSDDWRVEFLNFMAESPWMDPALWLKNMGNPSTVPQIYVHEAAELTRRLSFTAHASKYKVVLMWLPERLRPDAANKLLKTFEEPHPDTIFILTSNTPGEILPTIYSRCQRIKVPRYSREETATYLAAKGSSQQQAQQTAALAAGNLNRALALCLDLPRDKRNLDYFMRLMRLSYARNIAALKAWSIEVADEKREGVLAFLRYASRLVRENFILNLGQPTLNALTPPETGFSERFHPFIAERNVLQIVAELDKAAQHIASNGNPKIILLDLAISMILLIKV